MDRQGLCLGDLARGQELIVEASCERCGGPLGRYSAGLRVPERDFVILSEPGAISRTADFASVGGGDLRARARGLGFRGPRTQPGLYLEEFGGRIYMRKRCTCGANGKRRLSDLGELPLTIRGDGAMPQVLF